MGWDGSDNAVEGSSAEVSEFGSWATAGDPERSTIERSAQIGVFTMAGG
jgi:hypothetical protein